MNTVFKLDKVSLIKRKKIILQDVSQTIPQNKIITLMGVNGAGKTSLLRILAGLEKPTGGNVFLFQKDISNLTRKQFAQQVCYIPQKHNGIFAYTVKDFVVMGRNPYQSAIRQPSKNDWAYTDYILDKLNLRNFSEMPYTHLSSGEERLVLLARGLVQNAPVMLLDEPASNLDFYNEHKLMELICNLCKEEKKTIIISIHNPSIAIQYSDIIYCIYKNTIFKKIEKTEIDFDKKIIESLNLMYGTDKKNALHLHRLDGNAFVYKTSSKT